MRALSLLCISVVLLFPVTGIGQTTGDFRSAATGVWSTVATWETFNGTDWVAASAKPGSTAFVTIRNGHTITTSGTENCANLLIESGGVLNGDASATIASPRTLRINGTSVVVNGTLGDAAGGTINFEPNIASGTVTLSGSGLVNISRIRPNQTGVTIVLDIDTKVNYAGSSGGGGTGIQGNKVGTTYTINAGKTLSFGTNCSMSTGTGTGATANTITVNVYGTIDLLTNNGYLALRTTAGITATLNIYSGGLVKTGGNLTMTTASDGGSAVVVNNGTLTCNGTLDLGVAAVSGSGSSANTASLTAPASVNVGNLGAVITSSADLGATTVTVGHTEQTGNGNHSILRWYNITPTNNSGLNATLVFNYSESELNGIVEANLLPFRSTDDGATWTAVAGTLDATANTVTISAIDAFSRWTLGDVTNPLPVELVSFTGAAMNGSIELAWKTATEKNNYGFDVERSVDGKEWTKIGFVGGKGTCNTPTDYEFVDAAVAAPAYSYRLKQLDCDGTFAYSNVIVVAAGKAKAGISFTSYPNPFNPSTTIEFKAEEAGTAVVKVFNLLGQQVACLFKGHVEAGSITRVRFEAAGLPTGLYICALECGGKTLTQKILLAR